MTTYTAEETAANRKTWTDALRSGEFMQGTGRLRIDGQFGSTFCCFGVACELAVDAGIIERTELGYTFEDRDQMSSRDLLPPQAVVEWLGLADHSGNLVDEFEYTVGDDEESAFTLTELNDEAELLFEDIAGIIDAGKVKLAEVAA